MPRLTHRSGFLAAAVASALSLAAPASAQTLRNYHPRIFLSGAGQRAITPVALRGRCEAPTSSWVRACRVAAPVPSTPSGRNPPLTIINNALRYLLFNEDTALAFVRDEVNRVGTFVDRGDERGQLLANATKVLHLAVAYDWLYDALTPTDRETMRGYIQSYAEYALAHQPQDVFSAEAYAQAATVGLAGLAIGNPGEGAMVPATRYLAYAALRWRSQLLPAMGYTRGWWPEGPAWFNAWAGRYALYFAIAWSTATDEDLFAWARMNAGDPFGAAVRYEAYALRPDLQFPAAGDLPTELPSGIAGQRAVLDMLAWGTGSTVAQSLADEVSVRLPINQDYQGRDAWHQVVFYESARPSRPSRVDLPLAAHLSPTAADVVVMRGSWNEDDALHLTLSCGDWFTARQHLEAGSIQLYRRAPLLVHTGSYDGFETNHWLNWYAQRSAHANTLSVVRAGETFPNARMLPSVNDGGQRSLSYAGTTRATVSLYRGNLTEGAQFDTGGVTAFESSRFHDYAACNVTRAYNSTAFAAPGAQAKVREVTRQVVLLRPELVVVFDRVESTQPRDVRRATFQSFARIVTDRDGRFSLSRAAGRLLGRTLLPTAAMASVVDGYLVDGMTVDPLLAIDPNRGYRVEVTAPVSDRAREYFLHVFDATDTNRDALPPLSLVEDDTASGVRVADPSGERSYTVMFRREGDPGGALRVQDARGTTLYEGALGAGGTFYPAVSDGGVVRPGDASVDVPRGDAGVGYVPGGGGCGCRTLPRPTRTDGGRCGALLALAMGMFVRRRLSASSARGRRLRG